MVRHRTLVWAIGMCLAGSALPAAAKEDYGSWDVGRGVTITPSMSLEAGIDDNIYRTDSEQADSVFLVQNPGIVFEAAQERFTIALEYAPVLGQYENDSNDNYFDQVANGALDYRGQFTRLDLYASYERLHDERGSGPTNGLPLGAFEVGPFDQPTEYGLGRAAIVAGVGEVDARFRIDVGFDQSSKNYLNFKGLVDQRDYDSAEILGRLFINLTQSADLILEATFDGVDYDIAQTSGANTGVRLDSDASTYLIGATWGGPTTKGAVKLGFRSTNFDAASLDDTNIAVWDVNIVWMMNSATDVVFSSKSGSRETDNVGSYIEFRRFGVDVRLDLSDRLRLDVGLGKRTENFDGSAREDDSFEARFEMSYALRSYLTGHLGFRFSSRDSSILDTDFERNQVFLRAEMGL